MPDALDYTLARAGVQPLPGAGAGGGSTGSGPGGAPDDLDRTLASLTRQAATPPADPAPTPATAPQARPESALGSVISGIADTATSGFADEGAGLLETLGVTAGTDAKSVWTSGKGFSQTLADNIAYERSLAKADAAAKHQNADTLGTTSLQDLVDNPGLYQAHGIDPSAYSDRMTEGAAGDLLDAFSGQGRYAAK